MLSRTILLRRTATLTTVRQRHAQQRRNLTANTAHKRALSKKQLEGKKDANTSTKTSTTKETSGGGSGGSSAKPAADRVNKVSPPPSDGGSSGGGGGGALLPILALAGVGIGGAYYNGLIPGLGDDVISDVVSIAKKEEKKVSKELKEVVDEVKEVTKQGAVANIDAEQTPPKKDMSAAPKEEEEVVEVERGEIEVSLDHPEDGNRVDLTKINTFYETVNEGKAKQDKAQAKEEAALEAANKATQYNESNETRIDPMSAITSAETAMSELQSSSTLENSNTLKAAKAALQSDLDSEYFSDLDTLSESELRIRVVQLATEMSDRTKWEAVRLKEFLSMKEKEVGDNYREILQKQRLEFENLLAAKLREQEDVITRQANAALAAKEESIQGLMKATSDAREQEMKDVLGNETRRIANELEFDYQTKLQNDIAQIKSDHATELETHVNTMSGLKEKLDMLESRLEVSRNYESGSRKAHRVSAAALALANKLEVGEGAAVEIAALKGAAGEEGVIASAVTMIPARANHGGVPTVSELQVKFDESYDVGREAAMVPEGRAGLEGQLLGKLFAKLSVPPSPDAVPTTEEEGSVSDGILSLARKYVQLGDLEKAVDQLDRLEGQTAYVMNDWKCMASDRVSTERALKTIKLECALLNKDLVGES